MGYNDIFYENEEKYMNLNQNQFKNFIELFRKETGIDASKLYEKEGIEKDDYISQFYYLKYIVYTYYPKFINVFFNLLDNCGYDLSSEIIEAMKLIGRNSTSILDEDIKQYILLSPYIDDITNNKGKFTIHSNDFGDYSFMSTKKYLENNKEAIKLIKGYYTALFCHQMSWEMMKYLDDASIITSLLPSYFTGTYYHTTIRNEDGIIIDIANESVFDDQTRDFLFKGKIICETKKEDLENCLNDALLNEDEEAKKVDYPNAMLLTLHEQWKRL